MDKPDSIATVGQLRAALEGIADDTPLTVNAADPDDPRFVAEQVITSTGFGLVAWGKGRGLEPGSVFGLDCHYPEPEAQPRRAGGPAQPQAETEPPAAEREAAL